MALPDVCCNLDDLVRKKITVAVGNRKTAQTAEPTGLKRACPGTDIQGRQTRHMERSNGMPWRPLVFQERGSREEKPGGTRVSVGLESFSRFEICRDGDACTACFPMSP